MTSIPEQLDGLRFVLIPAREKFPKGQTSWQDWKNYPRESLFLNAHLERGGNYGVLTGRGVSVLDCDDEELARKACERWETFTVRTGRGGLHLYFKTDIKKRVVIFKNSNHSGEIQAQGQQVVGPGSTHPNGNPYAIENNANIAEVGQADLLEWLAREGYEFKEKTLREAAAPIAQFKAGFDIASIAATARLQSKGRGEWQGAHPVHGSTTGTNFAVNTTRNCWHCFRCDSGGGPLELIAVLENVINCDEARPGILRGERYERTLELAQEKYGMKPRLEDSIECFELEHKAEKLRRELKCLRRKR